MRQVAGGTWTGSGAPSYLSIARVLSSTRSGAHRLCFCCSALLCSVLPQNIMDNPREPRYKRLRCGCPACGAVGGARFADVCGHFLILHTPPARQRPYFASLPLPPLPLIIRLDNARLSRSVARLPSALHLLAALGFVPAPAPALAAGHGSAGIGGGSSAVLILQRDDPGLLWWGRSLLEKRRAELELVRVG